MVLYQTFWRLFVKHKKVIDIPENDSWPTADTM